MGRVAEVLDFLVDKVRVTLGGAREQSTDVIDPAGIETAPIKGDKVFAVSGARTGSYKSIGTMKSNKSLKAGEVLIYSRSADGSKMSKIYLKADGVIVANGVTITDGDVISATGVSQNNHTHTAPSGGGLTTAPTVGV